jgi:tetratricopeptide (TPR) repeat protein
MTLMPAALRIALLLSYLLFAGAAVAQSDDYQEAQRLVRAGQYPQAMDRVDNILKSSPKDARARFLKGLIYTEQNKTADAIKVFSSLTEDFPELPEPYNNLAVLYASQGQYDKARTALEMAIRTHPSYATAHENLGDIYAKMASQAYDKALQLDKGNSAAETKLGLIKELFSTNTRGTKPPARKTDSTGKSLTTSSVTAVPKPAAAAPASPAAVSAAAVPAPAAPAARPAEQAKPAAATVDPSNDVIKALNGWAKAWSDNDVAGYLSYYAPSFQTPAGESRGTWEAQRKQRIGKKKIDVHVESPKVKVTDNNRATVTFRQNYRSPGLKVANTKTLVMVKSGERWLIQQEKVGS